MKQFFFKYQTSLEVAFWVAVQALHAVVNAISVLHEHVKQGIPVADWEAYTWEFSSMVAILLLLPLVIRFNQKFSLYRQRIIRNFLPHVLASIVFSILHVVMMVGLREIVYRVAGANYDFGDWLSEFFYEYRKDVITYLGILGSIYIYRFIVARLQGEATIVQTMQKGRQTPDRLLIKKFGKEFVIRIKDIEWVEAAGNYMNIHIQQSVYPLRETMSYLENNLSGNQFVRIHRSYMINVDAVDHIKSSDSADSVVVMKSGHELKLSRRYREQFKSRLNFNKL